MIYQLTTQLGSPAILLRIKTWEPPAHQGCYLVPGPGGSQSLPWYVDCSFCEVPPLRGKEGLRVQWGQLWKAREEGNLQLRLARTAAGKSWKLIPANSLWLLSRGRCLRGTEGRLRWEWGGFWAVPPTQASAQPGARARGGQRTWKETGHTRVPSQSQETKPKT